MASSKPSVWKDTISGGFGGMCLVAAGHPLDTIKVRLQTMKVIPGQKPPFSGAMDCAMQSVRKEGALALYRGMAAPLMGVTPMYMVCFAGYSLGKKLQMSSPDEQLSLFKIWNAGCLSGVFTTAIMVPGERIKCTLQVQGTPDYKGTKYNGPIECIKGVVKTEGVRGLYRGTAATLLRDIPGSGAYFVGYELFKRILTPEGSSGPGPMGTLFAGGMAGVCNWSVSIPADVLKSRLQTSPPGTYTGLLHCYQDLVKTEGYRALYKGVGPVMLRAFPANAACFFGVEMARSFLNW
eukprot:CAMPEP_0177634646 /NCGR_PEP_ID=MMETSP0447-20121125/3478_1 /TAXON_ID=0 /ORGANISM="Stygamoeba regulata, Strain BSH-02190019" /LENGTH=292 /DNA_ID=CAMNT_0019136379 /DNA_START=68 /DNA_END=943 /DNA_ORIENTATION=-